MLALVEGGLRLYLKNKHTDKPTLCRRNKNQRICKIFVSLLNNYVHVHDLYNVTIPSVFGAGLAAPLAALVPVVFLAVAAAAVVVVLVVVVLLFGLLAAGLVLVFDVGLLVLGAAFLGGMLGV